jgi:hypothetical protein
MKHSRLANLALSDNGFLFDTITGHTYTLNETGALTLRMIIDEVSLPEIVERLTDRFDVAHDTALRDTELFASRLQDLGILNGD